MASPDGDHPAGSPLDAEREALRKAGYTEAEVSQILITRASMGSQQPASAAGSGVLSGTLNSLVAIASHARFLVPTFRKDVTTIFDSSALASSRAGATASLAVKMVVVAVLGYAGWQEWSQHIISATAIADAETRKRHAEECSARIKSMMDTVPMNRIPEATDIIQRDCDPTYAARAKACDDRFQTLLNEADQLKAGDPDTQNALLAKVQQLKGECTITDAQRQQAAAKLAKFQSNLAADNKVLELAKLTKLTEQVQSEHKAQHHDEAFKLAKTSATEIEALEVKTKGKAGPLTAGALNSLSWHALFARKYAEALAAAERSLQLSGDNLVTETNRAHALMLLGRTDDAKAIYLAHRGQTLNGKSWEQVISEDFGELRLAGIADPLMAEVEAALKSPSPVAGAPLAVPPTPSPSPTPPKVHFQL